MRSVTVNAGQQDIITFIFDDKRGEVKIKYYDILKNGKAQKPASICNSSFEDFKKLIKISRDLEIGKDVEFITSCDVRIKIVYLSNTNIIYHYSDERTGARKTIRFTSHRLELAIKLLLLTGGELLYGKEICSKAS